LAQLDRSRELAALLVDGADRSSLGFTDDEHAWSMGRRGEAGNCRDGVRIQSVDRRASAALRLTAWYTYKRSR
jgi:hypothetical protein